MKKNKFFYFPQNNSHGAWRQDKNVSEHVLIEALNQKEAINIAESIGCYFDGRGDCHCCGPRWYVPFDKGTKTEQIYGKSAFLYQSRWMTEPVTIHYKDGTIHKCGFGEDRKQAKEVRTYKSPRTLIAESFMRMVNEGKK